MMRKMRNIKIFLVSEAFILLTWLIGFEFFINLQVAFLSAYLIIGASIYSYSKMVDSKLGSGEFEEKRDAFDEVLDPYGFDEEDVSTEDFKALIKEEKKKIKLLNFKDVAKNSSATFSPFRLGAYAVLILGFIALSNNEVLNVAIYLPSLLVGIVASYASFKTTF